MIIIYDGYYEHGLTLTTPYKYSIYYNFSHIDSVYHSWVSSF